MDGIEQNQEAKTASQSEAQRRRLLEALPDMMFEVGRDGTYLDFVRGIHVEPPLPPEQFLGKKVHEIMPPAAAQLHMQKIEDALRTGQMQTIEYPLAVAGTTRHYEARITVSGTDSVLAVVRDITERKQTEEALQQSNTLLDAILTASGVAIAYARDRRIVWGNEAMVKLFGFAREDDYLGKDTRMLYATEDEYQRVGDLVYRSAAGKVVETDANFTRHDGSEFCGHMKVNILDPSDPSKGIIANIIDITERKNAEETLRASEARYSAFLNLAIFGIVIAQDGIIKYANQAHADLCGYDVSELVGSPFMDTVAPESRKDATERYEARVSGGQVPPVHDITILRKDGSKRYAKVSGTATEYDGKPAVMAIVRDVTSAREAEEALWESEQKFRAIFEAANDGMISVDPQTRRFSDANRQMLQMLGYDSEEEIANLTVEDIHPKSDLPFILEEFGRHARGEISRSENMPVQRKDGSVIYASIVSSPVTIAGKTHLLCIFRDITERKRAEEALRDSEEKYRSIFENTGTATVIIEEDTMISLANGEFVRLSGFTRDELEGKKSWTEFVVKEDLERMKEQHHLRRRDPAAAMKNYEFRFIDRQGRIKDVFLTVDMIAGTPKSVSSLLDITERKQAQEALQQSEERFRALIESSSDVTSVIDSQGRVLYQSPNYRSVWGRDSQSEIGKDMFKDVHPDDATLVHEAFAHLIQNPDDPVQLQLRSLHTDGSWRTLEVVARNRLGYPAVRGIVVNFRDITERRQAEKDLQESEERFRRLSEAAEEGIAIHDSGIIIEANEALARMFGYDLSELIGMYAELLATPESWKVILEHMATGNEEPYECMGLKKDSSAFWCSLVGKPYQYKGKTLRVATFRDITERKRAVEELRRARDSAQMYLDIAGVMLVALNMAGEITLMNRRGAEILGYDNGHELIGKNWFDTCLPVRVRNEVRAVFEKLMAGETQPVEYYENPALTKQGQERTIAWHNIVLRDETGNIVGTLSSGEDITERKRSEEQILASLEEKDALLKEIHHRVKNNMQIISSLLRLQASTTRSQRAVNMFRESQDRIRSLALIHDKLYHSQSLARIDLTEYVKCLVDELFNAYSPSASDVSVNVDVNVDGILVDMDTSIPCGLIINELVTNALKHAFPRGRGGEITVRVFEDEGDTLTLLVSDNGVGIPTTVDTKDPESLGLQLVNALTRQLGGTIEMDSTKGTSFRITFPRKRDA